MAHMTVGQLKKILDNYQDNTVVCGAGHFGEMLGVRISEREVHLDKRSSEEVNALVISVEDAGPEPY